MPDDSFNKGLRDLARGIERMGEKNLDASKRYYQENSLWMDNTLGLSNRIEKGFEGLSDGISQAVRDSEDTISRAVSKGMVSAENMDEQLALKGSVEPAENAPVTIEGRSDSNKTKIDWNKVISSISKNFGKFSVEAGEPYVSSAYGDEGGTMFSSVISGAATGAALGAMFTAAFPLSVVIGGIAGSVAGFFSGLAKNFEKKDDAFKSYVRDQFDRITQDQQQRLQNGINIVGGKDETYFELMDTAAALKETHIDEAMGKGYMEVIKGENEDGTGGLADQNKRLVGIQSNLDKAYEMVGGYYASLENTRQSLNVGAQELLLTGQGGEGYDGEDRIRLLEMNQRYLELEEEYKTNRNAGAEIDALLKEAAAIAENVYNGSEGAKALADENVKLVKEMMGDAALNDAYYNAGYRMGVVFSHGMKTGKEVIYQRHRSRESLKLEEEDAVDYIKKVKVNVPSKTDSDDLYSKLPEDSEKASRSGLRRLAAFGLNRVPYDNFPALLHQGERVLTASQARAQNRNEGGIVVNMGAVTVREQADIDRLAKAFVAEARRAALLAVPQ